MRNNPIDRAYTVVRFNVRVQLFDPSSKSHVGRVMVAKVMIQYSKFNMARKISTSSAVKMLSPGDREASVMKAEVAAGVMLLRLAVMAAAAEAPGAELGAWWSIDA